MKSTSILTAAVLAALSLAACDRPGTKSTSTTTTVTSSAPAASTAPATPTQTADSTTPNAPASTTTASTPSAATGSDSSNVVNDTLVTGKVKAAITADNGMKDSDISVKTENGTVTLTGSVKSQDQVTLAAALAQRQEGVNRVENQVTVK